VQDKKEERKPVVIKKYANRRLYNTDSSTYVTLEDLAEMVKADRDFLVHDAKTGEDITRTVLTQIIFEQENRGQNLLPIPFLRQLIRFYDDSLQKLVPSYLEFSLDSLAKEHEKFQSQIVGALSGNPFDIVQEQVQRNLSLFENALAAFAPFTGETGSAPKQGKPAREASPQDGADDLKALKDQLASMQSRLDELARK